MRSICFVVYPDGKVVGAVGTEFFPCQGDRANYAGAASEVAGCSVLPADMTFRRLRASVLGSGFATGESATITLRYSTDQGVSWSDSSLSVTVDDVVTEDGEDAVSVALSAGDLVTWKAVRSGGAAGKERAVWCCEIECAEGQPIFGHSYQVRSLASDLPPNAWRQGSGGTYYFGAGADATLKSLRAWCSAAPGGTASWDLDVRGAVDTPWSDTSFAALGFSASIGPADQAAVDASTTYALARGDRIYFRVVPSGGTPAAAYVAMSAVLAPDAAGRSTYSWRYSGSDTYRRYLVAGLGGNQPGNSTESTRQELVPSDDWVVRDAFMLAQGYVLTPGAGNERGADFRVDGADGNTTVLLGSSDVFDEDTTHTDELATGALIAWQWTLGTSGLCNDLGSVRVGFVLEDALAGGGPTDLNATGAGAIAGRVSASARGAIGTATSGAISGVMRASARGAIVARSMDAVVARAVMTAVGQVLARGTAGASGVAAPTVRLAIVSSASGTLSATVVFQPAGEFAALGGAASSATAALRGLASVAARAAATGTASASGTTTGSLSGEGLASIRGSATPRARVATTATNTSSLAATVALRAFGDVRASVALGLTGTVTLTAGIPVVLHPLPGLGVLVPTWQPTLSRTWRGHVDTKWWPALEATDVSYLDATLHPHLEEVP